MKETSLLKLILRRSFAILIIYSVKFYLFTIIIKNLDLVSVGIWGQFNMGMALIPLLLVFRQETTLIKVLPEYTDTIQKNLVILSAFTCLALSVLMFIFCVLFMDQIKVYIVKAEISNFGYLSVLIILSTKGLSELIKAYYRSREEILKVSLIEASELIGYFAACLVVRLYVADIAIVLAAIAICSMITTTYFYLTSFSKEHFSASKYTVSTHIKNLKFSVPLFFNRILNWSGQNIDKIMISYIFGIASLGNYFIVVMITSVIGTLASSVHYVLFPRLSKLWSQNKRQQAIELTKKVNVCILMTFLSVLVLMFVCLPTWNEVLFGAHEIEGKLMLILGLSAIFDQLTASNRHLIIQLGRPNLLNFISITSTVLLFILTIPASLLYGIEGAAVAKAAVSISIFIIISMLTKLSRERVI